MSASLPHRTLSNIRTGSGAVAAPGIGSASPGGVSSPHTPLRSVPSTFGSPSSLRAEEDVLVIDIGSRKVEVGFAGDAAPKATIAFTPESQRRVGDMRIWEPGFQDTWQRRAWFDGYELWRFDLGVKDVDLGLLGDKIERALREAFTKHLVIDSKPRKMILSIPSSTPIPHLSAILDTLFIRFQPPTVSLLSSASMATVAAGQRSALVIDIGWAETTVTAVYEYREVRTEKSRRAGKLLTENTHSLLKRALVKGREKGHVLSFSECEEVMKRMVWCKSMEKQADPLMPPRRQSQTPETGLETVEEEEEPSQDGRANGAPLTEQTRESMNIPLRSIIPPTTVKVPFEDLSSPPEATFFSGEFADMAFDDEEAPLPQLIYRTLLLLPIDVRAVAMSRLVFTGGCSHVLGLRGRIFEEVESIIETRGWNGVRGRSYGVRKMNKLESSDGQPKVPPTQHIGTAAILPTSPSDTSHASADYRPADSEGDDAGKKTYISPAFREPDDDPVEAMLAQKSASSGRPQTLVQGQLRAVDSLGAWQGASMMAALKVMPIACIDRDLWLAQGAAGASRPTDVDVKAQQRQSMGAGGLMRSVGAQNWTLGAWGAIA